MNYQEKNEIAKASNIVIASNDDFHEFLDICQSAREIHGNSFSYTLLESKDIV